MPIPLGADTKSTNFTSGSFWLNAMVSPEGDKHLTGMNFISFDLFSNFEFEDAFSDEDGNKNLDTPVSKGQVSFSSQQEGTLVEF